MTRRQRTKRRPPKPRPTSPGIPGDYFECNEEQLVQKLHVLRRVSLTTPMTIPSLLGTMGGEDDSSWNSALDDPDYLFEDFDNVVNRANDDKSHRDFMEKMDGEQISLHSEQPSEDNGDGAFKHPPTDRQGHSTPYKSSHSISAKSWEGSEIVLDSNSFVVDPFLLEKLQNDDLKDQGNEPTHHDVDGQKRLTAEERSDSSPRSITKMFQEESSSNEQRNSHHHPPGQRRARSSSSQVTSDTVSLSISATSTNTKTANSLSKDTPSSDAYHTKRNIKHSIYKETIAEEEEIVECEDVLRNPSKRKPSSARRWSFSSSVDDGHTKEMDNQQDVAKPHRLSSLLRFRSGPKRSASTTSRDYSSLQSNQELYLKLAEEEDLHDFQHINNFSYEGNYLFTRILRERMRLQLKRDMLHSADKDLYIEIHKNARENDAPKTHDRGVFFLI